MSETWSVERLLKLSRRTSRALSSRTDAESRNLDASIFRLDHCLLEIRNNYPTSSLLWIDDVGASLQSAYYHLNPPSVRKSKPAPPTDVTRSHADLRILRARNDRGDTPNDHHDFSSASLQTRSRRNLSNASSSHSKRPSLAALFSQQRSRRATSNHQSKPSFSRFRHSMSRLFGLSSSSQPQVPSHVLVAAKKSIDEWLVAVQAAREDNTADDSQSWVSLSDALPPLPQQYTPCRDNLYQCVRDAIISASLSVPDTACVHNKTNTVALVGPHGVGKTMLATELVHDVELCNSFADGVAWIQLAVDINDEELADQIISCVETIVSADFRETCRYSDSIYDIVERAQTLLSQVSCLVVIDDVSGYNARRAFQLVTSALGRSTVALYTSAEDHLRPDSYPITTDDDDDDDEEYDASNNITMVTKLFVKPLLPHSREAKTVFRSWLTKSQSDESRLGNKRNSDAQSTIIRACHGLPLALAMAAGFLSKFHASWQFLALSIGGCQSGQDAVMRIMRILQTKGGPRFEAQLRDIACLPQGLWVSLSTLADIWGMDYRTVKTSARRLGRIAFAEYRLGDSSDDSRVRFHWSVLNFCRSIATETDIIRANRKLVSNISKRRCSIVERDYQAWWHGCTSDKYICRRLHWHLELCGNLHDLTADYGWMSERLEGDGLLGVCLELDVMASRERQRGEVERAAGWDNIKCIIEEGALMQYNEEMESSCMPTFLVSRLMTMQQSNEVVAAFVRSIFERAKRPWLKPLPTPEALPPTSLIESGSSDSLESEDHAQQGHILASSASGKVICGDRHGNIQVYDAASGKNIVSWTSSNLAGKQNVRGVTALATVQDMVVSGHQNGQLFLRSIRSGRMEVLHDGSATGDGISCVATTETGTVAVGCKSGKLFVLRGAVELGCEIERVEVEGHCNEVASVHLFDQGAKVASSSRDGFAAIWDIDDLKRVSLNGHKPEFGHKENHIVTFAALDNNKLLSSCGGGFVCMWNTETGECEWTERVGLQFSCSQALRAFGLKGSGEGRLRVGSPYLIARNKVPCELLIVAGGKADVVATVTTEHVMGDWLEVWHPSRERVYVAVALADGRLLSYELVTWLK